MNPFPIILVTLDVGAAIWAIWHGKVWECIYWVSAATLTISIIGMGK